MNRLVPSVAGRFRRHALLATAAAMLLPLQPGFAQTSPPPSDSADQIEPDVSDEFQEIVVTGSLVQRNGFNAPTPVTVIGTEALERVSAPNIADVINQMPAVRASLKPTSTVNLGSLAAGNFIDLRGLGYQRTQILIDGRRYVPTVPSGGVSISSIPQALIRGVDIVTGGASAAYGSDAVAGVVNLRLDDKLEGVRGDVQGGISDHNDFRNFQVSLAAGMSAMDGRLRIVVGGEISQNDGIDYVGDRPWAAVGPGTVNNPLYNAANPSIDQPRLLLVRGGIRSTTASYGGVINTVTRSGPGGTGGGGLVNLQFMPDGSVAPFNNAAVGGDGSNGIADSVGSVPVDRYSGLGRVTFEASQALTLVAEFGYSKVHSRYQGLASTYQHTVRRDNVFIPDEIREILDRPENQNVTQFTFGRAVRDTGRSLVDIDIDTYQAVLGARGDIGGGWEYDAYYSYGRTKNRASTSRNRVAALFNKALDAVDNPNTPGVDPVCRVNVDANAANDDPACRPLNLFGENRFSQDAVDYVEGAGFRLWDIRQHVVAGTVRGSPFSTWAGPVSVAVGGEWRRQSVETTSDSISAAQAFVGGGTIPYSGRVTVKEAFGEVLIPLARDQAWAKNLSIDLAGRITDYSTSGQVETWKAGIDWAINDSIRLRATRSRDIRAPSLEELFSAGATSSLTVDDGALGNYLVTAGNSGNPDLTPEKADTFTAGIVLTPTFLPRFNMSIDYYDISLDDAIISLTPATIVDRCATGASPQLCQFIIRDPNTTPVPNRIVRVNNFPANLQSVKTRGIDFEAQYSIPFGGNDQLRLQALATLILHSSIDDGVNKLRLDDSVEQPTVAAIGGNPKWRFNVNGSYVGDRGRLSLTARYVGGGKISRSYDAFDIDPEDNDVKGRLYFDVSGEVFIFNRGERSRLSLYGVVNNLLDKNPPITGVGGYGTTRALYDTIGRTYTLGARFRF